MRCGALPPRFDFNMVGVMKTPAPRHIYKIVTKALWEQAQNADEVPGMPIDEADGYLHFSTGDQLPDTLRLYFGAQSGLEILVVRTSDVAAALRWEVSRGGALFPHLYAPLKRHRILRHASVDVDKNGLCRIPDGLL